MNPKQVRRHFAETARTMILESGVESVSIRKIADRAGYAYASIYNHFRNLDELLWYARSLIIHDFAESLAPEAPGGGADSIRATIREYLSWFLERPHAYRFLYGHQLDRSAKKDSSPADEPGFEERRMAGFAFLAEEGWSENDIGTVIRTLIYSAQGLLTLSIAGNDNMDAGQVHKDMDELIDFMIRRKVGREWKKRESTKDTRR